LNYVNKKVLKKYGADFSHSSSTYTVDRKFKNEQKECRKEHQNLKK
jgi:hypothetical protein